MPRVRGFVVAGLLCAAGATAAPADAPLVDAARAGDTATVRALLDAGATPDAVDADGTTALGWAAHGGSDALTRLLLEAGADPDRANRFGATPLLVAATAGDAGVIDLLLAAGADPDLAMPEGETALMRAARTGRRDAVDALLAAGAEVDARERWHGQTALMWAAAEGHAVVVEALLAAGADVGARSEGGFTPLLFATRHNRIQAMAALVDAGADIDETLPNGLAPLSLATLNAHYDAGVWLLEHGADPNADEPGWTALHQLVWARRPNLGFNNPTPIPSGVTTDLGFVEALVAHGADLNARQTREPRSADGSGSPVGYRNVLNRVGATPFLLAAKAADVELMRRLVELGADPLLPNEDGTTPLMVAAGVGIWAVGESPGTNEEALTAVELMLELGDGVTTVDANGDTALHGAVIRSAEPLVRFLVDRGADLEAVNEKGWTPLTIARGVFYSNTGKRWPEMERLLLELGAER